MSQSTNRIPMLPPGEQLRLKRIELELEIEDIANQLFLSMSQLEAIENSKHDELPSPTYIIGYWRSYARLLEIDLSESIDSYKSTLTGPKSSIVLEPNHQKAHGYQEKSRKKSAVVFCLLSAFFLGSIWFWQNPQDNADEHWGLRQTDKPINVLNTAQQPRLGSQPEIQPAVVFLDDEKSVIALPEPNFAEDFQPAPNDYEMTEDAQGLLAQSTVALNIVSNPTATDVNVPDINVLYVNVPDVSASETASEKNNIVTFIVKEPSWLDVRDDSGEKLLYRTASAGEEIEVTGILPFSVLIGFAAGVEVLFQGESVEVKPRSSNDLFARFQLPLKSDSPE